LNPGPAGIHVERPVSLQPAALPLSYGGLPLIGACGLIINLLLRDLKLLFRIKRSSYNHETKLLQPGSQAIFFLKKY